MAFFGFYRSGEIMSASMKDYDLSAHLSYNDVSIDDNENPSIIAIHLKKSKIDPFQEGCHGKFGPSKIWS